MCFTPQWCALFRHVNFQKWSDTVVIFFYILTSTCASRHSGVHFFDITLCKSAPNPSVFWRFWLGNVLRTTTACTFSTSPLLVQFFISHLASCLRTRRFSESTFRPAWATNHWKNTVNRDFPTFSRTCIFFLLYLSLLWSSHFFSSPAWLFTPLLFHLSILSEVWLLNFLRSYCIPSIQSLPITSFQYIYIYTQVYVKSPISNARTIHLPKMQNCWIRIICVNTQHITQMWLDIPPYRSAVSACQEA